MLSAAFGTDRRSNIRLDNQITKDLKLFNDTFSYVAPKLQDIKDKVDHSKTLSKEKHTVFNALSAISPIRRVSSVEDNINDGNYKSWFDWIGSN